VRLNPHHAAVDHTRLSMSFDFAFTELYLRRPIKS
jgi:hypothetical protein